jgi:uncharacterized GH25 family protein
MRFQIQAYIFTLLLLIVGTSFGHDMWLSPGQFVLSKGDMLSVHQLVGEELSTEVLKGGEAQEIALLRRITRRFELITPTESIDLLSSLPDEKTRPVVKPVLERKLDFEGSALVIMEHDFIYTEHAPEAFLDYLNHEELDVEELQVQMGDRPQQRERYARFFKALIQVGPVRDDDLHKQLVGQKLEILLSNNPYTLDPGDDLDVQILFEGKPLTGILVTAFNTDGINAVRRSKAFTDAQGNARVDLDHPGFWLLHLVHLRPCSEQSDVVSCAFVDWESYWASYAFQLD